MLGHNGDVSCRTLDGILRDGRRDAEARLDAYLPSACMRGQGAQTLQTECGRIHWRDRFFPIFHRATCERLCAADEKHRDDNRPDRDPRAESDVPKF